MRTRGIATVQDLAARGLVHWGPDGPRLQVPRDVVPVVRQDKRTIDAVLRRAGAFARQLATPSVDPFVRLREPKWTQEGCSACGRPIEPDQIRCDLCAVAVALVLEVGP